MNRLAVAILLLLFTTPAFTTPDKVLWTRLGPLDSNPESDSGEALGRPCIPGETVVVRNATGTDSKSKLGLRKGQFVVCIENNDSAKLTIVDGPGYRWVLDRDAVNSTAGFPVNWIAFDRDYLVWAYNRNTIIFRESLKNSYEGNFFYLLLDRSADGSIVGGLLIDSGTGYADLKPYILPLLRGNPLTVISTHSHWDHFGGHRHFIGVNNVNLLGYRPGPEYEPYPKSPEYDLVGLQQHFGLESWPANTVTFSVGSRKLELIPVPGHTEDSIAIYDYEHRLLFTGDTVYPGMLFVEDWVAFPDSLRRLLLFSHEHPIDWLLGGHVEMSAQHAWNGKHEYFFFGTNTHWNEHPLQMPPSYLGKALSVIDEVLAASDSDTPTYDATIIDQKFHSVPLVPVPFPGIPSYFRINAGRLVDRLIERHREHDQNRHQGSQEDCNGSMEIEQLACISGPNIEATHD